MRLAGSLALVTGAASGIGRATALELAARGARVITVDRDRDGLDQLASVLGAACLSAHTVDDADLDAMRGLARDVHAAHGALDVLVNNAGIGHAGGILTTPMEDFERVLDVNLGGVINGCHSFVPAMAARRRGQVVNVSSAFGYWPAPNVIAYNTSKFAVLGFTQSMRLELAAHGVGVTAVCPGAVLTAIVQNTLYRGQPDAAAARDRVVARYQQRGYLPARAARKIATAIERNTAVLRITPEAYLMDYIRRFIPWLVPGVNRRMMRLAGLR